MVLVLFYFILVIVNSQDNLRQVIIFSRHGSRYDYSDFINGNITRDFWLELTPVGFKQSQNLGEKLKWQYIDALNFVKKEYDKNEIQAFATLTNRATQSLQVLLYGMFKNETVRILPRIKKQLLQPPFEKVQDIKVEQILPFNVPLLQIKYDPRVMFYQCPNRLALKRNRQKINKKQFDEMYQFMLPLIKNYSIFLNTPLQELDLFKVEDIYDIFETNKYLQRPLPQGFTEKDLKLLQIFSNWYYYFTIKEQLLKVYTHFKFIKIFNAFDRRILQPSSYSTKMIFMSGHDDDMTPLFAALNLSSAQCMKEILFYGKTDKRCSTGGRGMSSTLIIELHEDERQFYVKVRDNGRYTEFFEGGERCEYNKFKKILEKYLIPDEIEELCGYSFDNNHKIEDK